MLISLAGKTQTNLDSLWNIWEDERKEDTIRLNAFYNYSWKGFLFNNPDSAFLLGKIGKVESKKVGSLKFESNFTKLQCVSLQIQSEFEEALFLAKRTLYLEEKLESPKGISMAYILIGNNYFRTGNYDKSIFFYKESLEFKKKIKNSSLFSNFNNIGNVYSIKGNYSEALKYYTKALKESVKKKDSISLAQAYTNIGSVYYELKNKFKSIRILQKSSYYQSRHKAGVRTSCSIWKYRKCILR